MSGSTGLGDDSNGDDVDRVRRYAISPDCSEAEFLAASKVYARGVVEERGLNVDVSDLEWDVSKRAKRRAGAVFHRNGDPQSVVLTWEYFATKGWKEMAATIRHELIHVHLLNEEGKRGHGPAFRRLADELDTHIHCERFAEPKWWVTCRECGARVARYRKSKLVKHPDRYRCGTCGGDLYVEPNE